MSFSGRTPESLLPRSDSKNPATTCKGLTANGRPCRRALAGSSRSSPVPSPNRSGHGVLAVLDRNDAAAFYCWQHKDQAEVLAARPEQKTTLFPLKEKSSIDSIAEKVGIIDLDSEVGTTRRGRKHVTKSHEGQPRLTKRDTLPSGWHDMQGPLMTVPEEYVQPKPQQRRTYTHGRSNVKASWSCCIRVEEDDSDDGMQPTQRYNAPVANGYSSPAPMQAVGQRPEAVVPRKPVPSFQPPRQGGTLPGHPNPSRSSHRPTTIPSSQTQALLSLIPSSVSPQTASLLLAELTKPLSPSDESGYIYIFWLTPDSLASKPDDETASSLLTDSESESESDSEFSGESPTRSSPADRKPGHEPRQPRSQRQQNRRPHPHKHRQSEALARYASVRQPASFSVSTQARRSSNNNNPTTASDGGQTYATTTKTLAAEPKRTVLLKIGRASNVHRRLTQWTKQCGQDITLVRFYPYQPHHHHNINNNKPSSSPSTSKSTSTSHRRGVDGGGRTSGSASAPASATASQQPRKCPSVARVERLIHLELADQRVLNTGKKCGECGREHKEWFEIEASRRGLRKVDAAVRRWVGWATAAAAGTTTEGGSGGGGNGGGSGMGGLVAPLSAVTLGPGVLPAAGTRVQMKSPERARLRDVDGYY